MASIFRRLTRQRATGKENRTIFVSVLRWTVYFVLSLFVVTAVFPAMAQQPNWGSGTENRQTQEAMPPNLLDRESRLAQQVPTASELLQQGRVLYQAGRFFEAASLWEQAARAYQAGGDRLNQAVSLNYLSSVYQDLGEWDRAREAVDESLNLLQTEEKLDRTAVAIQAQALNTLGSLELARGQTEAALDTWKQAEAAYDRAGNTSGKLGSQLNQAQALQTLGQYRRAQTLLEELVEQLQGQPDSVLKVDGLRSLGVALQTIGDLVRSKEILEQSWTISQRLGNSAETSATLFSIGNIAKDLQQYDVALEYYQQAQKKARDDLSRVQIQLNQLNLLVETERWKEAIAVVPQIQSHLSTLSPSRASIYARVNLAQSLMKIGNSRSDELPRSLVYAPENIAALLADAIQQARELQDPRAQAYALDRLGKLYEQNQQWSEAERLTQQALQIAQSIDAGDIVSRSSWQLARILKQEGNISGSLSAYQNAFETLQSLRSDLVAIDPDVQFNFKENVEPVYREYVGQLLQPNASEADLKKAREVIEALQLAELDNFFRDSCLAAEPVQIDSIDSQAAVIYPIILSDRLEVIVSLPNRPLRHYATQRTEAEIEEILKQLYSSLFLGYSGKERLALSQQVYDWLIRPAETDLAINEIKTLVFVLDGFLRNLPVSALYDGQQYLVEKYSIALSPGLQLFPKGLERREIRALAAGLTEARQGFSSLPAVAVEVQEIASEVDSKVLLDREFTRSNFQQQIKAKPFPVVHLATHGQFSSKPEETFLLTWNERIDIKEFERLLEARESATLEPIELLVLSACQTASGDKRATLGLAGFALRSGARSTLATLWSVSDNSTAVLMSEFYHKLTETNLTLTKAEALRQAQLSLLKNPQYNHPYFWAPFVLVGNWL